MSFDDFAHTLACRNLSYTYDDIVVEIGKPESRNILKKYEATTNDVATYFQLSKLVSKPPVLASISGVASEATSSIPLVGLLIDLH